jgi:D-ribulokinase
MKQELFLGIDVGSGSARAGFFTAAGRSVGSASHPIKMWKPQPDFAEQSSEDIWAACCAATKQALKLAGIKAEQVAGIGFDATCSLVVLDSEDRPVSVSLPETPIKTSSCGWTIGLFRRPSASTRPDA